MPTRIFEHYFRNHDLHGDSDLDAIRAMQKSHAFVLNHWPRKKTLDDQTANVIKAERAKTNPPEPAK